ncbi:MAG: phosphatase PAP2 family protein [Planctomycetaceae bacterium]|nr:MAG: phosphatase PAP2 family protein [Planctomycetaceae bacterium]
MRGVSKQYRGILLPLLGCVAFAVYWLAFGWQPMDRAELPLAALIHSAAGRSDFVDWAIIFFNRWWGEAVCVVLIYVSFLLVATRSTPEGEDRRRILGFSAVIFATWVVANFVGQDLIEPSVARESPAFLLGDGFTDLAVLHDTKVKVRSANSFPSNHGTVFMLVFTMSLYRYGRNAWLLLPVATLLSLPRCFTGAHWVGDSLVGSLLMTWLISASVMTTPLRKVVDRIEEIAVATLPDWLSGSTDYSLDPAPT